ncbi:amino acid ABC transporter substrate-binding protein [Chitinimonas arctica]|uniref:Amino acid ABC transporter substrate-binding protein n=1 Tax=Chitinimonas arctica TaxID=2594795 RepID=A0A516SIX6_9NEIS|nr:transporter substrate-binding domain-containing protein [Chitinimonas arctica]QDQ28093.1 amino acid ABC transporter substrate-binding protein [Chitinimonas arctica]
MQALSGAWLFLLLLLPTAWAADELLIVRGEGNYPPYEMTVDGQLTGAHIELVQAVAREARLSVNIRSVAWARALEMTKRGLAQAVSFAAKTPEREAFLLFDDANILSSMRFGVFRLRGESGPSWNGKFASLQPYRIGIARAYAYPAEFTQAPALNKFAQDGGYEALLRALHNHRVDVIVGGVVEINSSAKEMGYADSTQLLPPTFGETASYLAFSRQGQGPAMAERFAAALRRMRADGRYQKILAQYGM